MWHGVEYESLCISPLAFSHQSVMVPPGAVGAVIFLRVQWAERKVIRDNKTSDLRKEGKIKGLNTCKIVCVIKSMETRR